MTWDDLWTFYRNGSKAIRRNILKQVNLKELLANTHIRVQLEVLRHAPMDVLTEMSPILTPQARKKLGIEVRTFLK